MTTTHQAPTPEVLAECRSLVFKVAPERKQAPLYLTGLPDAYQAPESTAAFVTPSGTDFTIREMLVERGQWEGPGAVIAYCHPLVRDAALGITLHELAHLLPFAPPPDDFEPTEAIKAKQLASMSKSLADTTVGRSPTMPAWYDHHGLQFIRRCLHLHYRAWHAGFEIGLPLIEFAGPHYDLSMPWRYMRALGDEPRRMRSATFAEIEATEAPEEFGKLFNRDFHDWWNRREADASRDDEVMHEQAA